MPRAARLLTAKEVKAISKPGLTAVGGVTGLYLYIPPLKSPPMSARISGFFVCNKALNRQEMLEQTHCHIRLYGIVENG